jgi:DNA mismatch endonuclease, patch repair protein
MDTLSREQRSKTMRAVKSKDSKMELRLRLALWHKGYRYRKHYSRVLGNPDIAFVSFRIAIFCDSEFWHGYDWKTRKKQIKSNKKFWHTKIERNMKRDLYVTESLKKLGWVVIRFWGNQLEHNLEACIQEIENSIIVQKQSKTSGKLVQ